MSTGSIALPKPTSVDTRQMWRFLPTNETFGVWGLYAPGNVAALRYRLRDGHIRRMDLATSVLLKSRDWAFVGYESAAPEAVAGGDDGGAP